MKVFGNPDSACTKTALMVLREVGQTADFETIDLATGAHKSPSHLERHPFGRVPVLEDDGFVLYEVRAIARYLATKYPSAGLIPTDQKDQALMDQWMSVDACYFTPAAYDVVVQIVFMPMFGGETDQAIVDDAKARVMEVYGAMETQLKKTPYLVGDDVTLADICFVQYTESLVQALGAEIFADLPYVKVWRETMLARPSFEKALDNVA